MGAPATSPEAIPGCAAATLGGRTHIQLVEAKQTNGEGVRAAVRDERGDDLRDNDAPDGAPTGACVTLLRQLLVDYTAARAPLRGHGGFACRCRINGEHDGRTRGVATFGTGSAALVLP